MNKRNLLSWLLIAFTPIFLMGSSVVGVVSDGDKPLVGANVIVEGTNLGTVSVVDGFYSIDLPAGDYDVTASFIGYSSVTNMVTVDSSEVVVDFSLEIDAIAMSDIEVLASRADERTPVAYTTIDKAEMEVRLGSQDIPMALNTTPSVYATQQGGGAGDARINVRGFNQRNVSVMINGVPQNDMENGWVYWSNWDGVGDASQSIQMQRGLSAVNLATPSIGGSMNIITDPAAVSKGGMIKQEVGAGSFLKTSASYNTGLIGGNLALSGTIVRKTGNGVIDKTWTDAWAYYFGASYQMNDANRFEVYAIGAPQRHGQNLYKQNAGVYDPDFAKGMEGYDPNAIWNGKGYPDSEGEFTAPADGGDPRLFNQNWAPVNSSYKGQQYWYMYGARTTDRHSPDFLNERENFFHKPLVNLNHFMTINEKTRLSSVLYWSGGSGGGTGTYGSSFRSPAVDGEKWYRSSPWTWDWNGAIAANSDNVDTDYHATQNRSRGILRNSINRQDTYGLISKLNYNVSDELEVQVGLDWRTAGIEHAREVRDLLGGDYFVNSSNKNNTTNESKMKGLGDIIAYHNSTTVDWLGGFIQGKYTKDKINLYGMGGLSSIKYSYQDHFTVANEVVNADAISTFQVKGGIMYDVDDNVSVYANTGYVEKPPIMDNVIYYDGTVASDPINESFISSEAGVNFESEKFAVKVSAYNTDWKDRNLTKAVTTGQGDSGDTDVIFLKGIGQKHQGLEIEGSMKLNDMVRLDGAVSFGKWKFDGDADGLYTEYAEDAPIQTPYTYLSLIHI